MTESLDIAAALRRLPLFREVPRAILDDVALAVTTVAIQSGRVLFERGDPGDALYAVVWGRMGVEVPDRATARPRIVNEFSRDSTFGELALLTNEPRSATLRALRDSLLLKLPAVAFRGLVSAHPKTMMAVIRLVAQWLRDSYEPRIRPSRVATLAIKPVCDQSPAREFAQRLAAALAHGHEWVPRARRTTGGAVLIVDEAWWREHVPADATVAHKTELLNRIEEQHRFVLFVAGVHSDAWSDFCLRQADRILAVADATRALTAATLRLANEQLTEFVQVPSELILVHPGWAERPAATHQWLRHLSVSQHHHIRKWSERQLHRLVRHLSGNSVGLALAGGAARGLAEIGVVRAMESLGIPIDYIGGTSMGAILAAMYGFAPNGDRLLISALDLVARLRFDPTIPVFAVTEGREVRRTMAEAFGDAYLEDAWIPCYAVSTNITRAAMEVHRQGLARRWVVASSAVPGVLPPVITDDGDVLVDGAVVDNLPLGVLDEYGAGRKISVNVTPKFDLDRVVGLKRAPSPLAYLANWARAKVKQPTYPSLIDVLMRTSLVPSLMELDRIQVASDVHVDLRLSGFHYFDFKRGSELAQAGYDAAKPVLEAWLEEGAGDGRSSARPERG